MVNLKNKGYISPIAVHPGETVREALDASGMSQVDLSLRLNLSEKTISQILNGVHPVTRETALKLERVLGLSQELLVGLQSQYEADSFRLQEEKKLQKEVTYLPLYTCYNELSNLEYVAHTKDKVFY